MNSSNKKQIKKHWDSININYSKSWEKGVKKIMSEPETLFIKQYLKKKKPQRILDIGSGNGRILNAHINWSPNNSQIYGFDISSEMVKICKAKLGSSSKLKGIKVCDASNVKNSFPGKFDFITSIRCIKYNDDWQQIINDIYNKLNSGGTFIFDISNKYSINQLYRTKVVYYRQSKREIERILKKTGFKIIEIKTFSRIPDRLYELSNNRHYAAFLHTAEDILGRIFGKTLFGKVLFISVSKE